MAYEQKINSGSLFINDRKEKDTHPDLNGTLNVEGVTYWLSAWTKTTSKGSQFYSLSVKRKGEAASIKQAVPVVASDLDDLIPF